MTIPRARKEGTSSQLRCVSLRITLLAGMSIVCSSFSSQPSASSFTKYYLSGQYSLHRSPNSILPRAFHNVVPTSRLQSSPNDDNFNDDGNKNNNKSDDDDAADDEATRLQKKAQELRAQIRLMEEQIGTDRRARSSFQQQLDSQLLPSDEGDDGKKSLKNKRVLVLGANGRLGSMITRHLLRTHPELTEVVAAVHYVGQSTTRGWGRLSYEVGAEDGIGSLGPAWSSEEERNASFRYDPRVMDGYNLNKLRIVEVELLDPVQVRTITEGVDAVIFCATDFEGNRPRAIASLNAAFLFRAVASPTKGRVEIEGLRSSLEGLVGEVGERRWKEREAVGVGVGNGGLGGGMGLKPNEKNGPTQFILVSTSPDAFGEFETPFGEFNGLKRQAEKIVSEEFPSLTYSILQMGLYDERVEEGLEICREKSLDQEGNSEGGMSDESVGSLRPSIWDGKRKKRINRRDAARAAVEALLDEDLVNQKVQVFTAVR